METKKEILDLIESYESKIDAVKYRMYLYFGIDERQYNQNKRAYEHYKKTLQELKRN